MLENQSKLIIGIDEAGCGPLAGPVVAAAVVLCPKNPVLGLGDSKQLSAKKREGLSLEISQRALFVTVACVESDVIDRINILKATLLAMGEVLQRAFAHYPAAEVLIDGNRTVKTLSHIPQRAIVKGDRTIEAIMAASIVAKVHRDQLMLEFHEAYPRYGFAKHKGYGTKMHREAIAAHGPCPIHRMSFAPLNGGRP